VAAAAYRETEQGPCRRPRRLRKKQGKKGKNGTPSAPPSCVVNSSATRWTKPNSSCRPAPPPSRRCSATSEGVVVSPAPTGAAVAEPPSRFADAPHAALSSAENSMLRAPAAALPPATVPPPACCRVIKARRRVPRGSSTLGSRPAAAAASTTSAIPGWGERIALDKVTGTSIKEERENWTATSPPGISRAAP
jgi:hypothetical protein